MSLEVLNTLATSGTFFLIAATAIAAMIQLRHTRGSNQMAAFNEFQERPGKRLRESSQCCAGMETSHTTSIFSTSCYRKTGQPRIEKAHIPWCAPNSNNGRLACRRIGNMQPRYPNAKCVPR